MTFPQFISQIMDNPVLLVTVLLTLAMILLNGWTDALMPSHRQFPPGC